MATTNIPKKPSPAQAFANRKSTIDELNERIDYFLKKAFNVDAGEQSNKAFNDFTQSLKPLFEIFGKLINMINLIFNFERPEPNVDQGTQMPEPSVSSSKETATPANATNTSSSSPILAQYNAANTAKPSCASNPAPMLDENDPNKPKPSQ